MAKQYCPYRGAPKPFCKCGCGQRVRQWQNEWATQACVPKQVRSENCMIGRHKYTYQRRAIFFKEELARLLSNGDRLTREDILLVFARVYDRGADNARQRLERRYAGQQRKRAA